MFKKNIILISIFYISVNLSVSLSDKKYQLLDGSKVDINPKTMIKNLKQLFEGCDHKTLKNIKSLCIYNIDKHPIVIKNHEIDDAIIALVENGICSHILDNDTMKILYNAIIVKPRLPCRCKIYLVDPISGKAILTK